MILIACHSDRMSGEKVGPQCSFLARYGLKKGSDAGEEWVGTRGRRAMNVRSWDRRNRCTRKISVVTKMRGKNFRWCRSWGPSGRYKPRVWGSKLNTNHIINHKNFAQNCGCRRQIVTSALLAVRSPAGITGSNQILVTYNIYPYMYVYITNI